MNHRLVLIALAIGVAIGSFVVRRAIVAQQEQIGRQRYGQQISEQLEQIHASQQAQQRLQQKRAVLAELLDSLANNPQDTALLVPVGKLMLETGDTLGAIAYYGRYVDSAGGADVVALADYAFLLYATGERERGRRLTQRAIEMAPEYQIALYNMAVMAYDRGDIRGAIAWMERCRRADSASTLGKMSVRAIEQLRSMLDTSSNRTR